MDTQGKVDYNSPESVLKALLGLYSLQTADEQSGQSTVYDNGVGFNATDAQFLSSVAQWVLDGKPFTQRQFDKVSPLLRKYERQIETHIPHVADIDIPQTALRSTNRDVQQRPVLRGEGLLRVVDGSAIQFIPNVYPSKQIASAGFSWRKTERLWQAPFSPGAVAAVKRMFPAAVIDGSVNVALEEALRGDDLPDEIEENTVLFPYQKEAIRFLLSQPRAMLALAPGLGKTACATFAAHQTGERILVVSPLTLVQNWRNEIRKWTGETAEIWHREIGDDARWVITNYETVARKMVEKRKRKDGKTYYVRLPGFEFDTIIVDETILVKNRKAQRTLAIKALVGDATRVWLLSGSPASRFYDDMWAQLNILNPKRFSSYWRFADTYCHVENNGWGMAITGNRRGADAMLQEDLVDVYFSRTQDQVLDLPDWLFEDIEVAMSPGQYRPYKAMEDDFIAELGEMPDDKVVALNVLAQLTRLQQLASSPALLGGAADAAKWDAATEMLEWVEKPVIVWTNFIETAEQLEERWSKDYKVAVLTGKTPERDRQAIVDSFQAGEVDVLIAHPAVGKFGLTLTRARTVIYLERSFKGDDYYQSLHRVRRIGTKHRPYVVHLLATGPEGETTVDHVIGRILKYRKGESIKLTTGVLRGEWDAAS